MNSQDEEFKPGDSVLYVPAHAQHDLSHKDCEPGIVSSVNDRYVHVKFNNGLIPLACHQDQLIKEIQ